MEILAVTARTSSLYRRATCSLEMRSDFPRVPQLPWSTIRIPYPSLSYLYDTRCGEKLENLKEKRKKKKEILVEYLGLLVFKDSFMISINDASKAMVAGLNELM